MDAHLRMAIRVAGLMLVDAHELIFEYVLMLWSQLNMDLEQVLMPVGLGCAVRSSAIFCDGSIDLTCAEALHAKKRLKTLNTNVNKPNLQRLFTNKVFWLHRSAMLTGTSRSEHGGNQGSTCTS